MPAYELVIDPGGANETKYTSDGSGDGPLLGDGRSPLRFSRNPNAVSNWKAAVPYDLDLEDRISDEIWIQGDDVGFLFRGYLLTTNSSERVGGNGRHQRATVLGGYGVEYDLTRDETSRTFTNTFVADAIQTVWDNDTDFTATVTAPSASDSVTGVQIQEANTNAEFNAILNDNPIGDNTPLAVQNTNVELLQTAFTVEGEDFNRATNNVTGSDTSFSDGESANVTDDEVYEWDFTPNYDIPEGEFAVAYRNDATGSSVTNVDWFIESRSDNSLSKTQIGSTNDNTALDWRVLDQDDAFANDNLQDISLTGGVTYTLYAEAASSDTDTRRIDVVSPRDRRFTYTDDNSVHANNGFLDGPELFPAGDSNTQVTFDVETDEWTITSATLTTTFNNTSGNQRIQLRHANGTWGPTDGTEDNTESLTHDMGAEEGSTVQGRARLNRYPIGTSANASTPRFGYNGQKLQSWQIDYDGDDRPVVNQDTIEGSVFQVLQALHQRGRMDFWVDHKKTSATANSAEAGDVTETLGDITVKGRTRTVDLRDYANHVTVRGKTVGASRLSKTTSSNSEITSFGKEHADVFTTLATQEEVNARARNELTDLLGERETTGEVEIVAKNLPPGPEYTDVPIDADNDIAAQLVESDYAVRRGDLTSRLKFQLDPIDYGRNVAGLGTDIGDTKRGF